MKYTIPIILILFCNCENKDMDAKKSVKADRLLKISSLRITKLDTTNFEKNFKTVSLSELLTGNNTIGDSQYESFIPYPLVKKFLLASKNEKDLLPNVYQFRNKTFVNDTICLMVYKVTYSKYQEEEILISFDTISQKFIDSITVAKYDYRQNIYQQAKINDNFELIVIQKKTPSALESNSKITESKFDINNFVFRKQ